MIKVYRRLFVENRSLSSGVYDSISNGSSDLDSLEYDEIGFDGNVRDVENRTLSRGVCDSNSNGSSNHDGFDREGKDLDSNVRDIENRSLSRAIYDSNSNGSSNHDGFECEGKDLEGNVRDIENRTLSNGVYGSNSNGSSNHDGFDCEGKDLDGNVRDIVNRDLGSGIYDSNSNGLYEARDLEDNVCIIENRTLSGGVNDSNYNGTIPIADYDGNDFNNGTNSNDSHYSDDYEADFESVDTTIESLNGRGIDAELSRPDDEDRQSLAPTEIIDTEDLSNPNLVEIERPRNVQNVIFPKDLHNARINDDDNELLRESSSDDLNESHQRNNFEEIGAEESQLNDFGDVNAEESRNTTNTDLVNDDNDIELNQEDIEAEDCDDNNLNVTEVVTDENEETTLSAGTDYRQITTIALVHVDGTKHHEDKESTVYEESVKSVILPTRPVVRTATRSEEMQVDFEDAVRVVDNEDPPTILPDLSYQESSIEEIEQIRSGNPDLSQGSISMSHYRDSESLEPIAYIETPTDATSSEQNGAGGQFEFDISNDIHEILSYNFNESRKSSSNSKKRKADLDSKSVQTSEVSTRDYFDGEIFLKGAKVFRLCSCKDHVCH
ncbi:hypothetical protein B5X24_HaOG214776 [Helicoverpa armigera]|uniref:Uncharacterized protein n=1 Tax=Helicoverpa armigera TaxID=29058 RepID=A0A2W1B1S7_HELAM|nr:hypothetical protein B5X24_HaOG214776 [Helicoverpa armigera]